MKTIDPAVVGYVDQRSGDLDSQFPIMSVSKSFCGAMFSIMAAEGRFGDEGLESSLADALKRGKVGEVGKDGLIDDYLEMLESKELSGITLAQLLSHQHGNRVPDTVLSPEESAKYSPDQKIDFFKDRLPASANSTSNDFSYSNTAYELLEEVINVTSNKGENYLSELQKKILRPLGIEGSTVALTSAPDAMTKVGMVHIPPEAEVPFGGSSSGYRKYNPLDLHPGQQGSLAAGGLCSTINDMEKFSAALANMVSGRPSELTQDLTSEQQDKIHQGYKDSIGGNGYSLGLAIVEKDGNCVITKGGRFPGNKADMAVTMPFSLEEFNNGKTTAQEGEAQPETFLYMQHRCNIANIAPDGHVRGTRVPDKIDDINDRYQDALREYFAEQNPELESKFAPKDEKGNVIGGSWRKDLNEWRDELIGSKNLPPEFITLQESLCDQIGQFTQNIYEYVQGSDNAGSDIDAFKGKEADLLLKNAIESSNQSDAELEFVGAIAKSLDVDQEKFSAICQDVEVEQDAKDNSDLNRIRDAMTEVLGSSEILSNLNEIEVNNDSAVNSNQELVSVQKGTDDREM